MGFAAKQMPPLGESQDSQLLTRLPQRPPASPREAFLLLLYHTVSLAVPQRGLPTPALPFPFFVRQVLPCDDIWWVLSRVCCCSALSHALPVTASASGCVSLTVSSLSPCRGRPLHCHCEKLPGHRADHLPSRGPC